MSSPSPAKAPPSRVVLDGRYVRLEPIGPQHVASLYRAIALDPSRFDYLLTEPPRSEAELAASTQQVMAQADPMMWAVVDTSTGSAEGRQGRCRAAGRNHDDGEHPDHRKVTLARRDGFARAT